MDNYHIYEEIASGQFCVVYKGRRKKSIEYVSIKSVDKLDKARVLNEVKVLYRLDHPNVLKFLNWYETGRHIWVIVEYCTGGNLLQLLKQDRHLPEPSVVVFARDIASGLQHIHSQGYLHCDLKPSNMVINEYGMLKLCDLGLAQKVRRDVDTYRASYEKGDSREARKGTPFYMAPELFHPGGIHSYASDIWSFGCVLYELSTGRPPFFSRKVPELVQQIVYADYAGITRGSSEFRDLLRRCLDKNPFTRITWEELRCHPFWHAEGGLAEVELPSQPVFDYLTEMVRQYTA